jgi:Uncharacterized conserved protein
MRRLFKPRILRKMEYVGSMNPRLPKLKNGKKVFCFKGSDSVIWEQIVANREELFEGFDKSHRILLKINLNTADPYPASTDPFTLCKLLDLMSGIGLNNIFVGDCSSISALPTRKVFKKSGLESVLKGRALPVFFDEQEWVNVPVQGEYLRNVIIPKMVFDVDRIIYLANLKTHMLADFTMTMKLGVGLVHPLQRYELHDEFLQEKVVETMLSVRPDLVFLDARTPFITGGPIKGDTSIGSCIMAGTDMLSVDLEGYKLLYQLKQNNCIGDFTEDPFEMRQFRHAKKLLDLGVIY